MLTTFRNKFNFYGLNVLIESSSKDLYEKLNKDFSYFKTSVELESIFLKLSIKEVKPPFEIIPKVKPTFKRKYSNTYDKRGIRYNKYGEKALTVMDIAKEKIDVYSLDHDLAHELSYLIVLSRIGKQMDISGVHRIHAMGIKIDNTCAIFMMEMGGGKSTLLSHLLNFKDVEIISDDSPLMSVDGRLLSFPLRLGAYPEIIDHLDTSNGNIYTLSRQEYGVKTLISLDAISNNVAEKLDETKNIFFQGVRVKGEKSKIYKAGTFQKIKYLSTNMVVGVGLPMIFEYFWIKGIKDFVIKSKIALLRIKLMIRILFENDFYIFETGENPALNAKILYDFIKKSKAL